MQYHKYKDHILPSAFNILVVFVLILFLWYDLFLPESLNTTLENQFLNDSPLSYLLNKVLPFNSKKASISSFLLLLSISIIMIRINEKFSFINVRTILPAFIFAILTSTWIQPHLFSPGYVIALCMALSIFSTFRLVESSTAEHPLQAFNVGLLISVSVLFSFPCIIYMLIFCFFLHRCNVFSFRLFLATILGFLLPFLFTFLLMTFEDIRSSSLSIESLSIVDFFGHYSKKMDVDRFSFFSASYPVLISAILFLCIVLFSIIKSFFVHSVQNVKNAEQSNYLILCLLVTFLLIVFFASNTVLLFPLFFMYSGFIIGQFFSMEFSLFSKILMALFSLDSIFIIFYL